MRLLNTASRQKPDNMLIKVVASKEVTTFLFFTRRTKFVYTVIEEV